jgi:hypothetical protein
MQKTEKELLEEIRPKKHCLHELPFTHVVTVESTKNRMTEKEIYQVDMNLNSNTNTLVFAVNCYEYPNANERHDIQSSIVNALRKNSASSKQEATAISDTLSQASKSAKGSPYSLGCIALRPRAAFLGLSYERSYFPATLIFSGKDVIEYTSEPCECPKGTIHSEISTIISMHDTGAVAFLGGIHRIRRSEIVLETHKGDIPDSLARLHEESRMYESKNITSVMYMTAAAYLCAYDKENNQTK